MKRDEHTIDVDVVTEFLPAESLPEENRYVFAYTVTLRNRGSVPARLLTRHWLITDANGAVQDVQGAGVVGEHPYLRPGEGFRYTSAAIIQTPVGSMQGTYQMLGDDGVTFDAPIHPFSLAVPRTLH